MKLLSDSCRVDVRMPGGGIKSVPAFWHKLELGHDGSARGEAAADAAVETAVALVGCDAWERCMAALCAGGAASRRQGCAMGH